MHAENQCEFCKGRGKCAECGGSGEDPGDEYTPECSACSGTGRCAECDGTGKSASSVQNLWNSFWSLSHLQQRFVVAGAVFVTAMTVVFWRFMVPIIGLAIAVTIYLHWSRAKDSL
jgi:hypothetical protein